MTSKESAKLLRMRIQQLEAHKKLEDEINFYIKARETESEKSVPISGMEPILHQLELLGKTIRRNCPECGAPLNDKGLCSRYANK